MTTVMLSNRKNVWNHIGHVCSAHDTVKIIVYDIYNNCIWHMQLLNDRVLSSVYSVDVEWWIPCLHIISAALLAYRLHCFCSSRASLELLEYIIIIISHRQLVVLNNIRPAGLNRPIRKYGNQKKGGYRTPRYWQRLYWIVTGLGYFLHNK